MDALVRIILVYSAQIALVTIAAGVVARVIHLPHPALRTAYWRVVLAICLLLPLWPAHVVDVAIDWTSRSVETMAVGVVLATGAAPPRAQSLTGLGLRLVPSIPFLLAIGVAIRLAWLGMALVALGRLAATASEPIGHPDLRRLRAAIAPGADVCWHPTLEQPVAFGLRRPMILLPEELRRESIEIQSAVLCHELLHVTRGDWTTGAIEQIVGACLWFHPAAWWIIGRIQLCREEIVDHLAVAITGSRRAYLQALLLFADRAVQSPTTPFIHQRQLRNRVKDLCQEVVMTPVQSAVRTAVAAIAISATVWTVASAMPLRTESRYRPVTRSASPSATGRIAVRDIQKPAVLSSAVAQTEVPGVIHAQARNGQVRNAQTVAGQPGDLPVFHREPRPTYPEGALANGVGATVSLLVTVTINGDPADVRVDRWSLQIDRDIRDPGYWATRPQQAFFDACERAVRAWRFEPSSQESVVRVDFVFTPEAPNGTAAVSSGWRTVQLDTTAPPTARASYVRSGAVPAIVPVKVGGGIRAPRPIRHVDPDYPENARAAGIRGIVIIQATVGPEGLVDEAQILKSIPALDQAALNAVAQWTYEPTYLNGVAVPVSMTITVNFAMRQ